MLCPYEEVKAKWQIDKPIDWFKCMKQCGKPVNAHRHDQLKSLLELNCTDCFQTWYICMQCRASRKPMLTLKSAKDHALRKCKKNQVSPCISEGEQMDDAVICKKSKLKSDEPNKVSDAMKSSREANNVYLRQDMNGNGPAYLVALSLSGGLSSATEYMYQSRVPFFIKFTKLMMKMSWNERGDITELLNFWSSIHGITDEPIEMGKKWHPNMPKDMDELRRKLFRARYSILENVPHPPILKLDGHSYVSMSEIVFFCYHPE